MNQLTIRECIDKQKHTIENSWGSLRQFGYCAICSNCGVIFTPKDIAELMMEYYPIHGKISGNSLARLMTEYYPQYFRARE